MMGELLIFMEKKVKPKGLNPRAVPTHLEKYLFQADYQHLSALTLPTLTLPSQPVILYPACGVDIMYLLLFIQKILPSPSLISLMLNDLDHTLGIIKTILDDIGISFAETKKGITFYWHNLLVQADFYPGNIFSLLPELPSFDLYFERAFRIMKEEDPHYESKVFQKLNHQGILISDSGYQDQPLTRISVPAELSSYGEMIVGIKL